ncbi:regulation of mast cell degranulation [Branchiostoma belcheri]|nr:regulation of mast cell degranulation [Branchiostoma belcheri]
MFNVVLPTADESGTSPPPLPPPQGLSNTAVIVIAVVVSLAVVMTVTPCVETHGESSNSPQPPPPPQGLSNTAVIVIAVVVSMAVVIVAACVLAYLWARRKRREELEVRRGGDAGHDNHYMGLSALQGSFQPPPAPVRPQFLKHELDRQDLKLGDEIGSFQPPPVPVRPQFLKHEVDKKELELKEEIGRGAFGVVYLATRHKNLNGFPTEETVVVKTVHEETVVVKTVHAYAGAQERATFVREIETTLDLGKHQNLLGLVGCCTTSHPPYMVTEYMPYGDLKEFLLKCRKADERLKDSTYDLELLNKYQIARQIANGMIFISQAGYVHGDLAARNVLVGEDLVVKIADFGLATDVYERGYQRQDAEQKIPVRWMAPERLLREGRYTSKSDV